MRIKGVALALLVTLVQAETALCQDYEYEPLEFVKLSLEEQLQWYFAAYRDGHNRQTPVEVSGAIVHSYGPALIPYLKEYIQGATFFTDYKNPSPGVNPKFYEGGPYDISLALVALIWRGLHIYVHPDFNDTVQLVPQPYTLGSETIRWFVNEYKRRIDEYIAATGMIDNIVRRSELYIRYITGDGIIARNDGANPRYGHPNFNLCNPGRDLKAYYEQRLGIRDLKVDTQAFSEYAESAGAEEPGGFTVTIYTERELFPFEELTTPDGQPYNRAALGGKYVLVNLFATWHPYCRKENPSVQRLHERFPVLGVALGESGETVERYMREGGYNFPVAVNGTNTLRAKYAERLPASYVVGPDRRIVARIKGNKEWDGEEMMKVLMDVVEEGENWRKWRID